MKRIFLIVSNHPKLILAALIAAAAFGFHSWKALPVDVFPDIPVPRVTLQTEAGGLTAEEVEQLVTIPIETAMNGIPGLSTVRSSSGGGLSFVWLDFDWSTELARARFDVFERLSRVRESLPPEVKTEITPLVSVTGEIMLVALTSPTNGVSALELRELAEYRLRQRLLGVPGIGEVAVIGGRLPEYRIGIDPLRLAETGLAIADVIESARDTRTMLSAGYLAHVGGEEMPIRQVARADTLEAIRSAALPLANGGALRLADVAEVSLEGAPRRGSASYDGRDAVVLSVQKAPGGNTPELTRQLDAVLKSFASEVAVRGVEVHANAYRQADFIAASIAGGGTVLRDAVVVVVLVLLLTLLEVRTILIVLLTMPISILLGIALFPAFGLGVNVMTLGGFAVAAGDIVDAAIIFTEVVRRKLGENGSLPAETRRSVPEVIADAAASVAPGVLFSTLIIVLVFLPLLFLDGLESCFFRPLALAYLCVFVMSLFAAWMVVPAMARLMGLGAGSERGGPCAKPSGGAWGVRMMKCVYNPFLWIALKLPKTVLLLAVALVVGSAYVVKDFGSSFLPPFREDAFNVALSLPPGASLKETERVAESCVPLIRDIPGVLSVTRRTGRAERDQHAEPVSSSEYVVRVDLKDNPDAVKAAIRERLGALPGCSLLVGYPIAHRIGAVLSGTEAEVAINVYGESAEVLREVAEAMKRALERVPEVSDVRANREVMVRTLRIDYDLELLREAGLTLREAGEQVAAAFNGAEVGEVREGVSRRAVVVRLAGDGESTNVETVRGLVLCGRSGRRVRLDEVASIVPEEASNLMLREGGRRKALLSCNAAEGVDTGALVEKLRATLAPIARAHGCSVSFGGSSQARDSASRRLAILGSVLLVVILLVLLFALRSVKVALLALINVPLGLVGGVIAVAVADPVLSVSSLVGFVTVAGFVLRNGLLLLNRYQERMLEGASLEVAIREGSRERMVPIVMTSLTTVLGLVPIVLAGHQPGGELLAPLAIVQFGGILGATILNLVVLPAAAKVAMGAHGTNGTVGGKLLVALIAMATLVGCATYAPSPIDWTTENAVWLEQGELRFDSLDDVGRLALIGNRELHQLRLRRASSEKVAAATGRWDDPEADFDLMRVINPTENPIVGGASLAFTIPLSGVKGFERKAAEAYTRADAADIVVAEQETAVAARSAAVRLLSAREAVKKLKDFADDPRLADALSAAEKLSEAGELSKTEAASARLRRHQRVHRLREAEASEAEAETSLRRLLGIAPEVKLGVERVEWVESVEKVERVEKVEKVERRGPLDYVRHPKVQAALCRLDGSEAALEAEIRRQYPDLKLGPTYSREEGFDRLGMVAGLTLPLWNRNRKGIAEAEGVRNESKLSVIAVWRDLVLEADAAYRARTRLMDHPPSALPNKDEARVLFDAGELNALEYLAVCEETLDVELNEIYWRRDLHLAEENLRRYSIENKAEKQGDRK